MEPIQDDPKVIQVEESAWQKLKEWTKHLYFITRNRDIGSVNLQFLPSNIKKMCIRYSPKQRIYIVEHYFLSLSYTTIKIQFRQEFPNVTILVDFIIKRIVTQFFTENTLSDLPRAGRLLALTVEQKWLLCEPIEEEPGMSTQHLHQQTGHACKTGHHAFWADGMYQCYILTLQ